MIQPLRYRPLTEQLEFVNPPADEEGNTIEVWCWQCQQQLAFFNCANCSEPGKDRYFCQACFTEYHNSKRGKAEHKPRPIIYGDPVVVQTLEEGDNTSFPAVHQWVNVHYTLRANNNPAVIEEVSDFSFQSSCSGPCLHLQLLGCSKLAAADVLGSSDPFCVVYWSGVCVGATSVRYVTLNPTWNNASFVLPLSPPFLLALQAAVTGISNSNSDSRYNSSSSASMSRAASSSGGEFDDAYASISDFQACAKLPRLRIEVYDWDRLSANDFLGQAELSDADLLAVLQAQKQGPPVLYEQQSDPPEAVTSSTATVTNKHASSGSPAATPRRAVSSKAAAVAAQQGQLQTDDSPGVYLQCDRCATVAHRLYFYSYYAGCM
jgi:C2 domain